MSLFLEQHKKQHLRELQLKQLDILRHIDRICKAHGIGYWLDGGTLLGAVRHGGFIPWDDDIDIAMRLEDLPRFVEAAKKDLPEHLFMQTRETDPSCKEPIAKVRDLNSLYIEDSDVFSADYQKGIFVDIFPMIPYPSMPKSWVKRVAKGYSVANSILGKQHFYSWRSCFELFYFGAKRWWLNAEWNIVCAFKSRKTYISNTLNNNGYGIMHRQDSVFPLGKITFEGEEFSAPNNPDAYLSDLYRNYMQLPPEEKRKSHAVFYTV